MPEDIQIKKIYTKEEMNKYFSGVTDYTYFEDTDKMTQEELEAYIKKKYRNNKVGLVTESYSWFIIYGLFFGALFFGVGVLIFNQPASLQERDTITKAVISTGIALIVISFLICTYIMTVSAKLFKLFKNEDLGALYEAFIVNNVNKYALKKQRSDYAKWAIIYITKINFSEKN
jgi:hypothetical protein